MLKVDTPGDPAAPAAERPPADVESAEFFLAEGHTAYWDPVSCILLIVPPDDAAGGERSSPAAAGGGDVRRNGRDNQPRGSLMPFPTKRPPGTPQAERKPRKFTKDGTLVGCDRAMGPERIEVDGQAVDVEVQISRRSRAALVKLAAAALARPDGVKSLQGGLFRVVARPAADKAG
jgi:hypothetical protein